MDLITFGCSWTFGVSSAYTPGMTREELTKVAWSPLSESLSFRSLISKQLNLYNVNFAMGRSSNQRNFRLAREYFTDSKNIERIKDTSAIVLWCITSIYRNEAYDAFSKKYFNFKYDNYDLQPHEHDIRKFFLKYLHDDDNEIKSLTENMLLWNNIFSNLHVPVIWVDTFNPHAYTKNIPNLIRPNDMLTELLSSYRRISTENDTYHRSEWHVDSARINLAVEKGIVNPISLHPTSQSHEKIANWLLPYIKEKI